MLDWNWFFSSLAQSSAAIIGIFGAFVISKFLNMEEEYYQIKEEDKILSLKARRIRLEIQDLETTEVCEAIYKRNNTIIKEYFVNMLKKNNDVSLKKAYYDLLFYFCPYSDMNWIENKLKNDLESTMKNMPYLSNCVDEASTRVLLTLGEKELIDEQLPKINDLYIQALENIDKIKMLKSKFKGFKKNRKTIITILSYMIILFFVLVAIPLAYLPSLEKLNTPCNTIKIIMIVFLVIGFISFFIFFLLGMWKLKLGLLRGDSYLELADYDNVLENRNNHEGHKITIILQRASEFQQS